MKIVYISPLILLCFFSIYSYAQLPKSLYQLANKSNRMEDYAGISNADLSFKNGRIVYETSGTYYDLNLRYNIVSGFFEFEKDQVLYELKQDSKIQVRIDDNHYYFGEFESEEGLDYKGYFILISLTNDYSIYKNYTIELKDQMPDGSELPKDKYGLVKKKLQYYLESYKTLIELSMNKKEILKTFASKEKELIAYLKKEKLKLKKEEDLLKFVAKYNSIIRENDPHNDIITSLGKY